MSAQVVPSKKKPVSHLVHAVLADPVHVLHFTLQTEHTGFAGSALFPYFPGAQAPQVVPSKK